MVLISILLGYLDGRKTKYVKIWYNYVISQLKISKKTMAELKLRSKDPDSLRRIIQSALSERLQSVKAGIKKTEERIQEFETKYQLLKEEFIASFNNDELSHSFDFDEWIGESRMLEYLLQTKESIEDIHFVD